MGSAVGVDPAWADVGPVGDGSWVSERLETLGVAVADSLVVNFSWNDEFASR